MKGLIKLHKHYKANKRFLGKLLDFQILQKEDKECDL